MKNIFKLMAVAMLASSMLFVSCNKDEEEENNNNQNPTPAVNVIFGGSTWTSNVPLACEVNEGLALIKVYKTADTDEVIQMQTGTETNVTYNFYGNDYFIVYWDDTEDGTIEYNTCSEDSHVLISSISIDNKTISAVAATTVYTEDDTELENGKTLSVTLNNATWE